MPMLKIRGIEEEKILEVSTELINELEKIIKCPRDYFSIELVKSTYIMDGEKVKAPNIIEVSWFDRGQDIQDKVAKSITKHFKTEAMPCLDIIFHNLNEERYYENGEHF
ncbi:MULTISPECIES: DUF1904 family protein [Clostridium]|uniref:DUF1904 family protein n=1 Tax=Clostridium senegalense TaxID=1465809 RepID=A0A6M0H5Y3_9CLOT|nr:MULTISPECIES: DUF1904 family protein [Clostridium]NEU06136.1 DUF1904 family protein [Clostridium senegalense]